MRKRKIMINKLGRPNKALTEILRNRIFARIDDEILNDINIYKQKNDCISLSDAVRQLVIIGLENNKKIKGKTQ